MTGNIHRTNGDIDNR